MDGNGCSMQKINFMRNFASFTLNLSTKQTNILNGNETDRTIGLGMRILCNLNR